MAKMGTMDAAADSIVGARHLRAVVPSDTEDLPFGVCDALWLNDRSPSDINVIAQDDEEPVLMTCPGPGMLKVRAKRVMVLGTTAKSLVALY